MPRWIAVRKPFDYTWQSRAITHYSADDLGDHHVKDEVADFAVANGYATEGKVDEASRSTKGKKDRRTAKATDTESVDRVGHADDAHADRAAGGQPVDSDTE
jgi:hypothetical protein